MERHSFGLVIFRPKGRGAQASVVPVDCLSASNLAGKPASSLARYSASTLTGPDIPSTSPAEPDSGRGHLPGIFSIAGLLGLSRPNRKWAPAVFSSRKRGQALLKNCSGGSMPRARNWS